MRKIAVLVSAAFGLVVPGAASASGPPADPGQDAALSALLLTVDDFPAGWSVDVAASGTTEPATSEGPTDTSYSMDGSHTSDDVSDADEPETMAPDVTDESSATVLTDTCADDAAAEIPMPNGPPTYASATFRGEGELDIVTETVADFGSPESAQALLAQTIDMIERCPTMSMDDGSTTTYTPMDLPELGDGSFGFVGGRDGRAIRTTYVYVAVGGKAISLFGIGAGADEALMVELATTAAERLN